MSLASELATPGPPEAGADAARHGAGPAPLDVVLAIAVALAVGACLVIGSALVLVIKPKPLPGLDLHDQSQGAKTALYLVAVLVVIPAAALLGPRLVDAVAARTAPERLRGLSALLVLGLAVAVVAVRLAPKLAVRDGLVTLLVLSAAWLLAAGVLLAAAARGAVWAAPRMTGGVAAALLAASAVAVILCLTGLGTLNGLVLAVGALLTAVILAAHGRVRARPPAPWPGRALDLLVVVLLFLAVPNVAVFHAGGIPNAYFPPGVIQFHQDFLLGPVNQLLGGGALLVNVPVSQYGVGFIYFLAGWFHVAPIGYGTYGLLDGVVTALFYVAGYGVLRIAGVGRALAAGALAVAVAALVYHLYYSVGELPQQGPLRFGLPLAVIVAEVLAARWPARCRAMQTLELIVIALASVWSLEMLAYTLFTYLALAALRAWLEPAGRVRALLNALGLAVAAFLLGHAVLAASTLAATGRLPDWSQYAAYVRALVLGGQKAGQISYGFARWSPGLGVGAAALASALGVVVLARRARALAGSESAAVTALAGLSAYAVALFSYTDNRSSTYLLPYVTLPLLLAGVLWLSLLLRPAVAAPAAIRRAALAGAAAFACVLVAAAWSTVGHLFSQSALARARPGGGLSASLSRLWHTPVLDPRAPEGVRLLKRYTGGKRALILLPVWPDLGTEILMRSHRSNALFVGDPKADAFVASSEWTGKIRAQIAALPSGARVLTDTTGLRIAAALRGRPASVPIEHPIDNRNPQIEWILQQLADRFRLEPVVRARDGFIVARLERRR